MPLGPKNCPSAEPGPPHFSTKLIAAAALVPISTAPSSARTSTDQRRLPERELKTRNVERWNGRNLISISFANMEVTDVSPPIASYSGDARYTTLRGQSLTRIASWWSTNWRSNKVFSEVTNHALR